MLFCSQHNLPSASKNNFLFLSSCNFGLSPALVSEPQCENGRETQFTLHFLVWTFLKRSKTNCFKCFGILQLLQVNLKFEAIIYLYLFQSFAGMLIDSKPFSWNYFVFTKPYFFSPTGKLSEYKEHSNFLICLSITQCSTEG